MKGSGEKMNINCRFCGATVESSAKICPGCGKVMPSYRGAEIKNKSQFSGGENNDGLTRVRSKAQTPYSASRSGRQMDRLDENYGTPNARKERVPDNYDPKAETKLKYHPPTGSGKQANRSVIGPGLAYIFKFIIIILVGLVLYAVLRVFMVSRAGYDFKLDQNVTLASKSYGQAFKNYFEETHWWFDFSTNKVTFRGVDSDGHEYEMVFGRTDDGQTAVRQLHIDGKKINNSKNNIMNNYIMGMFMVQGEVKHASALGGNNIDMDKI